MAWRYLEEESSGIYSASEKTIKHEEEKSYPCMGEIHFGQLGDGDCCSHEKTLLVHKHYGIRLRAQEKEEDTHKPHAVLNSSVCDSEFVYSWKKSKQGQGRNPCVNRYGLHKPSCVRPCWYSVYLMYRVYLTSQHWGQCQQNSTCTWKMCPGTNISETPDIVCTRRRPSRQEMPPYNQTWLTLTKMIRENKKQK